MRSDVHSPGASDMQKGTLNFCSSTALYAVTSRKALPVGTTNQISESYIQHMGGAPSA